MNKTEEVDFSKPRIGQFDDNLSLPAGAVQEIQKWFDDAINYLYELIK